MPDSPNSVEILYEDGPVLAVLKPPGVLTQAPPGIDSLEVRIKELLRRRDARAGDVYLGVPHRLDRPSSGAMVFAKHARAARRLADQFEARTVKKVYWALVCGHVEPREGTWRDYVRKIPGEPLAQIVDEQNPEGRIAILHYKVIAEPRHGSFLEIELETGRTHQVRIQASSRGWPLLGDETYGSTISFGEQHEDTRLRAIALHARTLTFRHPLTQQQITVTAEPLTAWRDANTP